MLSPLILSGGIFKRTFWNERKWFEGILGSMMSLWEFGSIEKGKEIVMKLIMAFVVIFVMMTPLGSPAFAHCEIPCGIYDDEARFEMIAEHVTTIEKSMNQIITLSEEKPLNYNQVVRWIQNKERHADELQQIVSQYFMTQRLKPVDKGGQKTYLNYVKKLELLHQMLFYAMKAKQTTDYANIEKLRVLLAEFKTAYLDKHEH